MRDIAELDAFMAKLEQDSFESFDGSKIAYARYLQEGAKANIVISSGRIEAYIKYEETLLDLSERGFNLFIHDHRGQGLSQRLTDNPHMGHVDHFDNYVLDLELFFNRLVRPANELPNLLLCHSMGSAIGLGYALKHPNDFCAIACSAPMLKIKLPAPEWLLKPLAKALNLWDRRNLGQPGYVMGGGNYDPEAFEFNHITQCPRRYARFRDLYQQQPQAQLGSPSNHWLAKAISFTEKLRDRAIELSVPTLILGAELDTIVDNQAMKDFARDCHDCIYQEVPQAFHELLMEKDPQRQQSLDMITAHYGAHLPPAGG
ncbi:alpha/beta fold hydrolase [Paraferrimonas sedimenticola]|uniref:Alpha/beta hydrolase n=1 Tax=Paraferrimonas sedimenticola TaxID=375674 RepID=A0AA37RY69_9GAMM|nr:alpha/beta fold hydrolase [Paraferrimonas sedimenticola]GLP97805.1 alpha/beta hydrolase [Paraferrimonas sedimenticola]